MLLILLFFYKEVEISDMRFIFNIIFIVENIFVQSKMAQTIVFNIFNELIDRNFFHRVSDGINRTQSTFKYNE